MTGPKMDTPGLVTLPSAGSSWLRKGRELLGGWGTLAGTALCTMPVDLYMTPLIL